MKSILVTASGGDGDAAVFATALGACRVLHALTGRRNRAHQGAPSLPARIPTIAAEMGDRLEFRFR
jgi:hypothetical protein